MPRKPNYDFERHERQRAKAIKKAARLEEKKQKLAMKKAEGADPQPADTGAAPSPGEPSGPPEEDDGS